MLLNEMNIAIYVKDINEFNILMKFIEKNLSEIGWFVNGSAYQLKPTELATKTKVLEIRKVTEGPFWVMIMYNKCLQIAEYIFESNFYETNVKDFIKLFAFELNDIDELAKINDESKTAMMAKILENCEDKVTKDFLIKWAESMPLNELRTLYKDYLKTKKKYKYSDKKIESRIPKGTIELTINNIKLNVVFNY